MSTFLKPLNCLSTDTVFYLAIFFRLYKTIHELLTQQLDETEEKVKKGEDVVQIESKPDDPSATHEELSNLQVS